MNKYDWSNVPKEVMWIASDSDGYAFGWCKKPFSSEIGDWLSIGKETDVYLYFHLKPINNPFQGNWQDSLEERPK